MDGGDLHNICGYGSIIFLSFSKVDLKLNCIVLVSLTVPREGNIIEDHAIKTNITTDTLSIDIRWK